MPIGCGRPALVSPSQLLRLARSLGGRPRVISQSQLLADVRIIQRTVLSAMTIQDVYAAFGTRGRGDNRGRIDG